MKYVYQTLLAIGVLVMMSGCEMSKKDIESNVKSSMQNTLDKDTIFRSYHLQVKKVVVVKQMENSYKGIATVSYNGKLHNVSINVTVSGFDVMWEAPPGSFMFVLQDSLMQLLLTGEY